MTNENIENSDVQVKSRKDEMIDLFKQNYLRKDTAAVMMTLAVLAFLNVFVTHLFDGTNEYLLIAIFSIISLLIELSVFGGAFYLMTHFESEKYAAHIKKLTIVTASALTFTAFVKLLIVIFF